VQIPLKSAGVHEFCLPVHSPYGGAMKTVISAQAGIQEMMPNRGDQFWTPACAGATELPFLG
jgi:hypothetical protein